MSRLPPAPALDWTENGAPFARAFGDVYFSRAGGLAEADAVFLGGCGLPDRWRGANRFAILELGLGAGLNALAALRLWRRTRAPGAVLHFVSIEAFPMAARDARRVHGAFPEIADESTALLAHWPVRAYAPQRARLAEDFVLTAHIGEAEAVLADLDGAFDAFFLDGFSPARNSAMWTPAIARDLARLAAPGARAATYSVAGDVRRALEGAGWRAEKKPGFSGKRERLEAHLVSPPPKPHPLYPVARAIAPERVAIIGGGVAGAACAEAVRRRGGSPVLIEAGDALGAGASGNPGGLVMPRLDRDVGPRQSLFIAAFLHAVRAYAAIDAFTARGVIERARGDLADDPPLPDDWLTLNASGDALHHRAGMVSPARALRAWSADVAVRTRTSIRALEHGGDAWRLHGADGAILEADAIILAGGARLDGFDASAWAPLRRTLGQIEWGAGAAPAHAVVDGSYAGPLDGGLLFGATFDRGFDSEAPTAAARRDNLAALEKLAPALRAGIAEESLRSRAAVRAATPDHLPLLGLLPDAPAWRARFAGIAHGRPPDLSEPAPAHEGLYALGALGARGLTFAPLLAEALASEMFGEPSPLTAPMRAMLHPARFLHRALKRGDKV